MVFLTGQGQPQRLGVLPGSFNPPTRAHLALAEAALAEVDQVVLVLPRAFPHKNYEGASLPQRAKMLQALAETNPRLSAALSAGGLFIEIARECRAVYGPDVQLTFVCGRDAAERIIGWKYDSPHAVSQMLGVFRLLVACRLGAYQPPAPLRSQIRGLELPADYDTVSASEVRRRISEGEPWEHLVPESIIPILNEMSGVYGRSA